jgi:N utilization substance protein B
VVIDEALELAKTYGTAQSSAFVNGILDRMVPSERRRADAGVSRNPASDAPPAE